ncbi:fasciclin domain-containing protein [Lacinutrix neustonica]|uniref:Fasciclin domain-containing protein n=1 Tax=Lacinutrix neustonica TaxID=2980107 RepID=A0A9E8SED1_9FLAO|nr:fasciclin domain-containing protein [Lacinutrix neustonica]WAC03423.1 fasciclin domain-containing protein [Lacinutrix neustonica]
MKKRNLIFTMAVIGGLFMSTTACKQENKEKAVETEEVVIEEEVAMKEEQETPTIVGVAAGNENFSTLVAAVQAADLVDTLNSDGPFTVFAPTNDAFNKLPAGTVETLLKPENKGKLSEILTYHVVSGNFDAAAVTKAIAENNGTLALKTVQGEELSVMIVEGNVILKDANGNTATVVMADVMASNGVIHAINAVVMPK